MSVSRMETSRPCPLAKPPEPQTMGRSSLAAPSSSSLPSALLWVEGMLRDAISGNCVVLRTLGQWAILQTNLRSHSNPEKQRWWPEMIRVGEVLPPKTHTQGKGSVLRVLTPDPGLTLPPAGWVSDQGHLLLWACFFICMGVPTTFRILYDLWDTTHRQILSLPVYKEMSKCQNRVIKIKVRFNSYNEQIHPLNLSPHPTHYISTDHQWQQ